MLLTLDKGKGEGKGEGKGKGKIPYLTKVGIWKKLGIDVNLV